MASARLALLLLLVLVAASTTSEAKSLKICSTPSCVLRNGTRCDRTNEDCPRCLTNDPLLGSTVCMGLQTGGGGVCLQNYTLCPETPLETSMSSDAGYEWQPLNATTTEAPTTTRAPVQQAVANNVPLTSTGVIEESKAHGFPTWTIAVMVGAAVLVAGVLFIHMRHKKLGRRPRESTLPVPPPFKDDDRQYECSTNISSPHSFHSFDCQTIRPERAHQQPSTDLSFVYGPSVSGTDVFVDSDRSYEYNDDVDVFLTRDCFDGELEPRGSLGVDEIVVVRDAHDVAEEVDIYPDTAVTRLSGAGRMFSPKTTRTLAQTNMTTFSIDDQENDDHVAVSVHGAKSLSDDSYPDTSVVRVHRPPSTGALDLDVVDVWESHRASTAADSARTRHSKVEQWKRKYAPTQ